jgi:hypothetical protein
MKTGRPTKIRVGKPTYYSRNREQCLARVKARQQRLGDAYRQTNAERQRNKRKILRERNQPSFPLQPGNCRCDICQERSKTNP